MISLTPYLVYDGNCEEAFIFYKEVFRSKDLYLAYYKDAPDDSKQYFLNAPDESIMHATLKIDKNTTLLGNDNPNPSYQTATAFSGFYLYIETESTKEAIRIFHELSAGGRVIVPIAETFWSPMYGVLIDKFGISWKLTSHQTGEK